MSEDWKPGDLAVCVDARAGCLGPCSLKEGQVYLITGIGPMGLASVDMRPTLGLFLQGASPLTSTGFAATRFRKVKPDQHQPCEEEFITLLNRTKRRVGA